MNDYGIPTTGDVENRNYADDVIERIGAAEEYCDSAIDLALFSVCGAVSDARQELLRLELEKEKERNETASYSIGARFKSDSKSRLSADATPRVYKLGMQCVDDKFARAIGQAENVLELATSQRDRVLEIAQVRDPELYEAVKATF